MSRKISKCIFWGIVAIMLIVTNFIFLNNTSLKHIMGSICINACLGILIIGCLVIRKKATIKIKKVIANILYVLFPVIIYWICESILGYWNTIEMINHLKNLAIYYFAYFIIVILVRRLDGILILFSSIPTLMMLVQYFVVQFRGRPLFLQDLFAVKTAVSVVGSYSFHFEYKVYMLLVLYIMLLCMGRIFRDFCFVKERASILVNVVLMVLLFGGMNYYSSKMLLLINMWDISITYQEGGNILTLLSQLPYTIVDKPANYSVENVKKIGEAYIQETVQDGPQNIIVIMNETFSDLEYIGDVKSETDLLPYWKSLKENVIRGNLYVPVFGAGTSNSEYEVLTGNELDFMVPGTTPYQLNVGEDEISMASILETQGYVTTALHPYKGDNWNRDNVYEYMGFDTFYSDDNWGGYEVMRWCASDKAAYDKVISIDEESDKKNFIFLVTMQNHGGYAENWDNFTNEVSLNYDNKYPEAEQYLSLLQESDRAFKALLEYYNTSDERTMIVMFGDHQAALEEEFYEELYGKSIASLTFEEWQSRYVTPFVIWTNYDIEEKYDVEISTNYFGSFILQQANVQMTAYNYFLLDLMELVPVIGMAGVKAEDGIWYPWSDIPEKYMEQMNNYKMLQYNNIFDRSNRVSEIFTLNNMAE